MSTQTPWADGPREILQHASDLLKRNTDTGRRLAMILVDNAVEQMIKTFLQSPKRVSKLNITRQQRDAIADTFPAQLDAMEAHAPDKLTDVDTSLIDWYHRQRNQLYHEGFGLTIPGDTVEVYLSIATTLCDNLFGKQQAAVQSAQTSAPDYLLAFIQRWATLEQLVVQFARRFSENSNPRALINSFELLVANDIVNDDDYTDFLRLRLLRNGVIHGTIDKSEITVNEVEKLGLITAKIEFTD